MYSFIVVGAGIAGCLIADRLQKQLPPGSVLLVEQDSRLGGRILTRDDGMGGHMEFGAMRISEHHVEAISLCEELGVTLLNFQGTFNKDTHIYINNQICRVGKSMPIPEALLNRCLSDYVNKHHLTLSSQRIDDDSLVRCLEHDFNCPYHHLTFSSVLSHIFTAHEFEYYKKTCGYDYLYEDDVSFYGVIMANRGLQMGCKYYAPKDGMREIIDKLSKRFIDNGGKIDLEQKVVSIDSQDDFYQINTENHAYHANAIIFTIPPHLLMAIEGLSTSFEQAMSLELLTSCLGHYSSIKAYAYFDKPWWTLLHPSDRQDCQIFRTDLPLRQGLYPNPKPTKTDKNQMMLIQYSNCLPDNKINPYLNSEDYANVLSRIHGIKIAPPTLLSIYNWDDSSCGLAAHYLKCGAHYTDCLNKINDAFNNIYFAGEALSTQHGWISGAIESVDRLLNNQSILRVFKRALR